MFGLRESGFEPMTSAIPLQCTKGLPTERSSQPGFGLLELVIISGEIMEVKKMKCKTSFCFSFSFLCNVSGKSLYGLSCGTSSASAGQVALFAHIGRNHVVVSKYYQKCYKMW